MNREQAEKIARKHHLQVFDDKHASIAKWVIDSIMEAVAVEREACAKVCEERYPEYYCGVITEHPCYASSIECAVAIRARGNE